MPAFIHPNPEDHIGTVVGNGHCVPFLQLTGARLPHTSTWRAGEQVLGNQDVVSGTAIATFDANGRYGNRTDGSSHAAVFVAHSPDGVHVIDQWQGRPVGPRLIRNRHGAGPAADDASRYSVIVVDA